MVSFFVDYSNKTDISINNIEGVIDLYEIPTHIHPDFRNKHIPIKDNNEKLVNISKISNNQITEDPQYVKQGLNGALNNCYLRESVVELLINATKDLPKGYKFLIWDGYRPFEVQKAIYDDYYNRIKQNNPERNESDWHELTQHFVSYPSINKDKPAPHITGGAVDLAIIDDKGKLLEFGTKFDDFSEKAHTAYYETLSKTRKLTKEEQVIRDNRRLLYHALTKQGFTNYYMEWWHFDYGNQWWAQQKDESEAIYGITNLT